MYNPTRSFAERTTTMNNQHVPSQLIIEVLFDA